MRCVGANFILKSEPNGLRVIINDSRCPDMHELFEWRDIRHLFQHHAPKKCSECGSKNTAISEMLCLECGFYEGV
jgi:hypothetical protein